MTTNYVTLVNNAIQEAGCDLASFASNGSDFNSASIDPLMKRFKAWTARAWRDIQQEAMDWEFMNEQGLVNIDPGIMLFVDSSSASLNCLGNTTKNLYDQDGTVIKSNLNLGDFTDLKGTVTINESFGYINLPSSAVSGIDFSLKPSAEYVPFSPYRFDVSITTPGVATATYYIDASRTDMIPFLLISGGSPSISGFGTGPITTNTSAVVTITPFPGLTLTASVVVSSYTGTGSFFQQNTVTGSSVESEQKAYVHSWKSFNFSEETGDRDFQEEIQEINQESFRLIDYYNTAPQNEKPLQFVPWESFRDQYDLSGTVPGIPRLITEDDTGRYRFYPHPNRTYSVKFEYTRNPQLLSLYSDVPTNLDNDYVDLIMWKTIMYYGEYDEQPTVVARAYKNYKTLLQRFEMLFREKFHFKPARLY